MTDARKGSGFFQSWAVEVVLGVELGAGSLVRLRPFILFFFDFPPAVSRPFTNAPLPDSPIIPVVSARPFDVGATLRRKEEERTQREKREQARGDLPSAADEMDDDRCEDPIAEFFPSLVQSAASATRPSLARLSKLRHGTFSPLSACWMYSVLTESQPFFPVAHPPRQLNLPPPHPKRPTPRPTSPPILPLQPAPEIMLLSPPPKLLPPLSPKNPHSFPLPRLLPAPASQTPPSPPTLILLPSTSLKAPAPGPIKTQRRVSVRLANGTRSGWLCRPNTALRSNSVSSKRSSNGVAKSRERKMRWLMPQSRKADGKAFDCSFIPNSASTSL